MIRTVIDTYEYSLPENFGGMSINQKLNYYRKQADFYFEEYHNMVDVESSMAVVQGVLFDMLTEAMEQIEKSGMTENLKTRLDRLMIIESKIGEFSSILMDNIGYQKALRRYSNHIRGNEIQIDDLKTKLNTAEHWAKHYKERYEELLNSKI